MTTKLYTENAGFPAADYALIDLLSEIAVQSFFENNQLCATTQDSNQPKTEPNTTYIAEYGESALPGFKTTGGKSGRSKRQCKKDSGGTVKRFARAN